MLTVDIDSNSGFCAGVIRAISKAEEFLKSKQAEKLYSLGAIVHNDAELTRLVDKGLVTIVKDDLDEMVNAQGESLLIRAHGEPPSTYAQAKSLGFKIIDCTCPVVLKLQQDIKLAYEQLHLLPFFDFRFFFCFLDFLKNRLIGLFLFGQIHFPLLQFLSRMV